MTDHTHATLDAFSCSPHDDVATIATRLLRDVVDSQSDTQFAPVLVSIRHDGSIVTEQLLEPDAVRALRGRSVDHDVALVGLVSPAHVTPVECSNAPTDGVVAHVVDRTGRSATVILVDDVERTFGPTDAPQTGRVPDSCRRILGLPTEPPHDSMLDFVVAAWLEIVTRRALEDPSIGWSDVVALHPAAPSLGAEPTVTEVARATVELGESLDWERFRRVIAAIGGFPFGDDAETTAAWMDAGMFSRWAGDELADPFELLDLLDATLAPSVSERLWATVRLTDDT